MWRSRTRLAGVAVALACALVVVRAGETSRPEPASAVLTVGTTVSDMARALAFYTTTLPFRLVSDTESSGRPYELLQGVFGARARIVRLRLGEEELELTQYYAPRGRPMPVDSRGNDRWFQHFAIIVSDMDRAYARLRRHRVEHASTGPQRIPDWNRAAAGIRAFMPIYPAEAKLGQDVKQAVEMEKVSGLSSELEQALQKQGLWWDHYLVIDRAALGRLVQLAGGIDLGKGRLNGQQVTGLLPIADPDAQTSLALQARIAQGLCKSFGALIQRDLPGSIFELLIGQPTQQSVYSDLTHSDLTAFWSRSKKVGDIACEFPTLIGR